MTIPAPRLARPGRLFWILASLIGCGAVHAGDARAPNLVILIADDLGYGDLGCYGHPTIRTPHLDRMAAEGLKLTQYYAAPVCTPSRAALLTGRMPVRSGLNVVLYPTSKGGIPDGEITLADALKARGYATSCIGKWHLGHLPAYLPTRHGFDHYFGIPYSNDMNATKAGHPPIPLLRDETIIEQPAVQETLTLRYTREALSFIRSHCATARAQPFFLYLAYTSPHIPLHAGKAFRGRSPRGLFGDVVEEIDWSAGQILAALRDEGIAESTLVVFTSDNGPWLSQKLHGGSAGLLREGKASTWEGGVRVPCLAWWPGTIAPRRTSLGLASELDLFTTCLDLARQRFLKTGRLTESHWRHCCVERARAHAVVCFTTTVPSFSPCAGGRGRSISRRRTPHPGMRRCKSTIHRCSLIY